MKPRDELLTPLRKAVCVLGEEFPYAPGKCPLLRAVPLRRAAGGLDTTWFQVGVLKSYAVRALTHAPLGGLALIDSGVYLDIHRSLLFDTVQDLVVCIDHSDLLTSKGVFHVSSH